MPLLIRNCHGILRLKLTIRKEACDEIEFWDENVNSLHFHSLGHLCNRLLSLSILTHPITPVVLSSIITIRFSIKIGVRQKVLKAQDCRLSTICLCPQASGQKNVWFTNNTSVVSIVHNGSKVKEVQFLALSIFNVCAHHQLLFT